jgi:hypothetical protein
MNHPIQSIRRAAARTVAAFAAAATLLLAACGGGGGGGGTQAPADPATRASVGAAGGSVASPDGKLTLTIPAGALGNSTEITITEVSPANVPAHLQASGVDRVFKLEPAGLQFAQPATLSVTLPAADTPALLFLDSGNTIEAAADQSVVVAAAGRVLSGQIGHFSFAAVKELRGFKFVLDVDKRSLEVGQVVKATATITKTDSDEDGALLPCIWDPFDSSILKQTAADECTGRFFRGTPFSATHSALWECKDVGTETIVFSPLLTGVSPVRAINGEEFAAGWELRLPLAIDVACSRGGAGPGEEILEGVFDLPFGMTLPDGIAVLKGPIGPLFGEVPRLAIAGSNGVVAMDLRKNLSALDMTFFSPIGGLGNNLLGVLPITRPNPGPQTPAALYGTGPNGYLRHWDTPGQTWGLTLVSLAAVVDAFTAGGFPVADVFGTVTPTRAIDFHRFDGATNRWSFDASLSLTRFQFEGTLRSASWPVAGGPVVALTTGTDGGTTSALWWAQPGQTSAATRLHTMPGVAKQVRCAKLPSPGIGVTCAATYEPDQVAFVWFDPDRLGTAPVVQTRQAGLNPIGVGYGWRADGGLRWVVSNFDGASLDVFDEDEGGVILDKRTIDLIVAGCGRSAHAATFSDAGKNYAAGSCYDSAKYFAIRLDF